MTNFNMKYLKKILILGVKNISDFKMTPMNIKDSESADDESSGEESTPTKGSPAKQKRKSSRIPPEGREKPKLTCSMTRDDESMESIHGVSGSMVDLVKGKINIYYQTYIQKSRKIVKII